MQTVSDLYNSIVADNNHWFETSLLVGSERILESNIFSLTTKHSVFENTMEVGRAIAGEIDVTMLATDVPTMGTMIPCVRACNDTSKSEWIKQGVFYVDTRETSQNGNGLDVLTIHGFDAMLKAEQPFQSETITGDSTDVQMVNAIAAIMGVEVDARTYERMTQAYTIPLPTGYTCREVLGYIASMYVGCFIMTEEGKLRLVSVLELPPETNYLIDENGNSLMFGDDVILI